MGDWTRPSNKMAKGSGEKEKDNKTGAKGFDQPVSDALDVIFSREEETYDQFLQGFMFLNKGWFRFSIRYQIDRSPLLALLHCFITLGFLCYCDAFLRRCLSNGGIKFSKTASCCWDEFGKDGSPR